VPGLSLREFDNYEGAIRRFKRACEKAGILSEVRKREFYEKPSIKRKRKSIMARKKAAKRF